MQVRGSWGGSGWLNACGTHGETGRKESNTRPAGTEKAVIQNESTNYWVAGSLLHTETQTRRWVVHLSTPLVTVLTYFQMHQL
jgi:hypothetical protein